MMNLLRVLIYYPMINLLIFFIWLTPGHYAAVGIILLTLFVRFVLLVPSRRAARDQHRMASLQPVLNELKEKYGDDKQGLAAAQMEVYKENNINPFSSCVVFLIQVPIIYILYYAFLHGFNVNNPHIYSFVPKPDLINANFLGINLFGVEKWPILAILAAILQYVQVRLTMPAPAAGKSDDPTAAVQRNMVFVLPLVTFFAAQRLVSGIALYWSVTTLFSIVQQYYVNKEKVKLQTPALAAGKADIGSKIGVETPKQQFDQVKEEKEVKKGVSVTVRRKK